MKRHKWVMVAVILVLALMGGACGGEQNPALDPGDDAPSTDQSAPPTFDAGTTMDALQKKGRIVVGVKFDQPGFGQSNPATGKVEGFDVEIAKLVAAGIFGGDAAAAEGKIEFKESVSKNREPFIQNGEVDLVIATYTISDTRKQVVDFAGPYFVAQQDIMVKKDDNSIKSVNDLNGKKVCTAKGSTSEKNLRAKAANADVTLFDTYSQCAEAMTDGRVVAVTTDNTILAGLVQASNGAFKLVKAPFSDEPYGIGLKKGDQPFRDFINERLEEIFDNGEWAKAFEATLGKIGLETPEHPKIDRYTTTAGGATTTGAGGTATTTGSGTGGSASTTAKP